MKINFSIWKIKIKGLLTVKYAWKITTGDKRQPTNIVDLLNSKERNNIFVSIIKLSISGSLLTYVDGVESAHKIWKMMALVFSQKNKA